MKSLSLSIEAFAAERRRLQDVHAQALEPLVKAAVGSEALDELLDAASDVFASVYASESDTAVPQKALDEFLDSIREVWKHTKPDSDVQMTSLLIASAAINSATLAAGAEEGLLLEWVTMEDEAVRTSHREVEGEQRPPGEPFQVAGVDMPYPGFPLAPIELWANCRCVLRPASPESLTAAPDVQPTTLSIMAIPTPDQGLPTNEEAHATLVYLGEYADEDNIELVHEWVKQVASDAEPFSASVKSLEPLGDANAVWMLDESDLNGLHEGLMASPVIAAIYDAADITKYPAYTPHVTATYEGEVTAEMEQVAEIAFDTISVWHGSDRVDYPLGADMDDEQIAEVEDQETEDSVVEDEDDISAADAGIIPWHGVLALEGRDSGDGRFFATGSLTHRMMSDRNGLPLTWQPVSSDGHDNAFTIGGIAGMGRDESGKIWGWGWVSDSAEKADEFIGFVAEFGKVGVSIDADDAVMTYDEERQLRSFSYGRIASACAVNIPALASAWVALGEMDAEVLANLQPLVEAEDTVRERAESEGMSVEEYLGIDMPEAADADLSVEAMLESIKKRVSMKRGPGWITHPEETRRLHKYWTTPGQPGYAKIGWGSPGDFNRCRVLVGEKIAKNSPEDTRFLNRICAQWHHDALGIWPGEHHAAQIPEPTENVSLVSLAASASKGWDVPSSWFQRPEQMPDTGISITEEGHTFGYIAEWGVCHIGIDGVCTEAPGSATDYAYFATGIVTTADGENIPVGTLTVDTGHADGRIGARAAAAHYDNTGTAWAYVNVGEDDRGIWFSGMVKPGTSEDTIKEILASGRLSGDWRRIAGNLELVAALTVNVPGFPIMDSQAVVASGEQVALLAAGVVQRRPEAQREDDPVNELAAAVVDEMEARQKRRARLAAVRQQIEGGQ